MDRHWPWKKKSSGKAHKAAPAAAAITMDAAAATVAAPAASQGNEVQFYGFLIHHSALYNRWSLELCSFDRMCRKNRSTFKSWSNRIHILLVWRIEWNCTRNEFGHWRRRLRTWMKSLLWRIWRFLPRKIWWNNMLK